MTAAPKELSNSLKNLSLNPTPSKSSSSFKKPQPTTPTPESWEDEESSSSGTETETETDPLPLPLSPQTSTSYPSAPPPTPISPSHSQFQQTFASPSSFPYSFGTDGAGDSPPDDRRRGDRRPEKTDAVAKRLIAGALGVRAPKKTEEQRAYDRAVREKEGKRRLREKEDAEAKRGEAERAKAAVWED